MLKVDVELVISANIKIIDLVKKMIDNYNNIIYLVPRYVTLRNVTLLLLLGVKNKLTLSSKKLRNLRNGCFKKYQGYYVTYVRSVLNCV